MRHADLRREAATVIAARATSALSSVWYLVWVCGRVSVCFVVEMSNSMDSEARFLFTFFDGQIESKKSFFLFGSVSRIAYLISRKKVSRKSSFSAV